jgi:malate/lactate dehydrogenase
MVEVAILGAGELGGSIAHALAQRDFARTIRLIDEHGQIAAGKALDLMQSAPVEKFVARIVGSSDRFVSASAAIVVIADRAKGGEWTGEEGLMLLRQVNQLGRGRIVICAGPSQRELVESGVREAGFSAARLIGSAPEALTASARAIVALETDASVREVNLTIVGVPPKQLVLPWEEATVGGRAATTLLSEPTRRRVEARIQAAWPPGPHALALAAADAVAAIVGQTRRTLSCFLAASADAADRERTSILPARLSSRGATRVELPALAGNARAMLENATLK